MSVTGEAVVELAAELVEAVGPRPAGSAAATRAQGWVANELSLAGWVPEQMAFDGHWVTWTCRRGRSPRVVLFMAHTDTVPGSPGANDNAAGVAALVIAAMKIPRTPRRTVCFAFPDAEEIGLRGSRGFARAAIDHQLLGGPIDQVMSLDLVGAGRLTHNGLGAAWGAGRLRELLRVAPAEAPWVYRGLSYAFPQLERSDHAWFGLAGIPSSHLMARGPSGVTWTYHTAGDTVSTLDPVILGRVVRVVRHVARARPLPEEAGGPAAVVPGGVVIGPWAVRGAAAAGIATGVAAVRWVDRSVWRWLVHAVVAGSAFGLATWSAAGERWMGASLATPAVLAGWLAWGALAAMWPWRAGERAARAIAVLPALAAVALWVSPAGPLFALPMAVSAAAIAGGAGRAGAVAGVVACWPAVYFVRPDAVRELAFHQMIEPDPWLWSAVHLALAGPALAVAHGRRARSPAQLVVGGALLLLSLVAIVVARQTPVIAPPFVEPWFGVPLPGP